MRNVLTSNSITSKPPVLIGVYGSLREGLSNHPLLQGAELVGTSRISGVRMVSLGGFPAVYSSGDRSEVLIEVYNVTSTEILRNLDRLEGHPRWYCRSVFTTEHGDVEVYLMHDPSYLNNAPVPEGDWVQYLKERKL